MENNQELNKIWSCLGELEGVLCELEDLQNLLITLQEEYFDKAEVDLNDLSDRYTLWRNYPYQQSLLSIIDRCLCMSYSTSKDNIYKIYDSVKLLKTPSSDKILEKTNNNKLVA